MYNWMNEHNVLRKMIAVISLTAFVVCFVLSDAWALVEETEVSFDLSLGGDLSKFASLDVDTFTIPAHLGEVKEVFRGKGKQFVIHLQDAHANFYAQGKISDIIDYLNKEYGIRIVNLEGGVGDYDLSVFTAISGKAIRREVADYFVKKGEINGAELYAINNPDRVLLWGVEDKDLYLANLKVYRDSLQYKPEVDGYLEELTSALNDLKRHIYGPRLLEIDMAYNAYKAGNMEFREYLEFLIGEAAESGVNIDEFANLHLLYEAMEQEEKVDFNKANTERSILIDDLKDGLSQNEVRQLVSKSLEFKTKKISRKAFYGYLLEKAKELGLDVKKYPALSAYIEYITTYEEVDRSRVMSELDELEAAIKEPLYENDAQRELNVLSRNLALMKNIFAISLTKTDYKYFLEYRVSFNADNYVKFIEKEAPKFRIKVQLSPDILNLNKYLKEISRFYEYSFERDVVFLKNLRYEESAGGQESAIMMTGGFHTENLLELFEKAGISYVTILPKFKNEKDYKSPYFEILAGQTTNLQRMLGTVIAKASTMAIASKLNGLGNVVYGNRSINVFKASVVILSDLTLFLQENGIPLSDVADDIQITGRSGTVICSLPEGYRRNFSVDQLIEGRGVGEVPEELREGFDRFKREMFRVEKEDGDSFQLDFVDEVLSGAEIIVTDEEVIEARPEFEIPERRAKLVSIKDDARWNVPAHFILFYEGGGVVAIAGSGSMLRRVHNPRVETYYLIPEDHSLYRNIISKAGEKVPMEGDGVLKAGADADNVRRVVIPYGILESDIKSLEDFYVEDPVFRNMCDFMVRYNPGFYFTEPIAIPLIDRKAGQFHIEGMRSSNKTLGYGTMRSGLLHEMLHDIFEEAGKAVPKVEFLRERYGEDRVTEELRRLANVHERLSEYVRSRKEALRAGLTSYAEGDVENPDEKLISEGVSYLYDAIWGVERRSRTGYAVAGIKVKPTEEDVNVFREVGLLPENMFFDEGRGIYFEDRGSKTTPAKAEMLKAMKPSVGKGVLHIPFIRNSLVKLLGENTYDNYLGPLLEEVTFYLLLPALLSPFLSFWPALVVSRGIFIILHPLFNEAKGNRVITPLGISLFAGGVEAALSTGYIQHMMVAASLNPIVVGFLVLTVFHMIVNAKMVPAVNRGLEKTGSEYRIEKATLVKIDKRTGLPEEAQELVERHDIEALADWLTSLRENYGYADRVRDELLPSEVAELERSLSEKKTQFFNKLRETGSVNWEDMGPVFSAVFSQSGLPETMTQEELRFFLEGLRGEDQLNIATPQRYMLAQTLLGIMEYHPQILPDPESRMMMLSALREFFGRGSGRGDPQLGELWAEYNIPSYLERLDNLERNLRIPGKSLNTALLNRYGIQEYPGWEGDADAPEPQLIEVIGEGTAAVVFRARIEGVEGDVAVKVRKAFDRENADSDEDYERIQSNIVESFRREMRVQGDLSGIGSSETEIMPAYYSVNMGGVPAFGMEIIEGVNTLLDRPQDIRNAVNERTRPSAERVLRTLLSKGYAPRDLQFMVLTEDQTLNGRSYSVGEVVLMDVGNFVPARYAEDQVEEEVSGWLSELDRQIRVARTESRMIEEYNSLHVGEEIETIVPDPGKDDYKVIFKKAGNPTRPIKQFIYLSLLEHFRENSEVPDIAYAIEGSAWKSFPERVLQRLEVISARFMPYLERTLMMAKLDVVSFFYKRVIKKAVSRSVPIAQPVTGNIASGFDAARVEEMVDGIKAQSDEVKERNVELVEQEVESTVEAEVPPIVQFEALKQILQSRQAAREMAEWQHGAYYRGIGEEAPPLILAEEEGTAAVQEKIAMNLAGVYALESGMGVICERDNVTPLEVLASINERVNKEGKVEPMSEKDMLLLARFANATWKAGQVFRGLGRIERDTFTPAVTLIPEELKKDFDQIYAASEQLYERLNYVVSGGMDAGEKRYLEGEIEGLMDLIKEKGSLSAEEERRLNETALTVMYAHKDQRRKDGQPYFVHQLEVAIALVELFGVTDPAILQIALLHDTREDEAKFYDDFRTFAHETIRRVENSEGRMAEKERVDETLLGVRMLSKLEGEKYEKEFPTLETRQRETMRRLVYPKTAYDDGRPGSENWYNDDFIHDVQLIKLSDRIANMHSLSLLFTDGTSMDNESIKESTDFVKRQLERTLDMFIPEFVDNPGNQLLPEEIGKFYDQFASAIRKLIALKDGPLGERGRSLMIAAEGALGRLEQRGAAEQTEAAKGVIADLWQNKTDIIVMPGSKLEAASQAPVNRSVARKLRRDYGQDTIPFDYGYGPDWRENLLAEMPRIEAIFGESLKAEKDPRILFYLPITQAERDRIFEAGGLFEKYAHLKDRIVIVQEGNIPDDGVVDNVMHIVLGKALLNYDRIGEANFDPEAATRLVSFMGTLVEPGSIDFDAYKDAPKEMLNDIINGVLTLKIKKIDFAEIQDWKRAQNEVLRAL